MSLKVKDRAKPKLPPVAPGVYIAVCVGVVDLGEQYNEKFRKYQNDIQVIWELTGETVEVDGERKPRQLSRTFPFAAGKKSGMRAFFSSCNGVQYTDEQFRDFDLKEQVGKACQLNVVLNDTGEYANIDSAIPLPRGVPAPKTDTPPLIWDMDEWDDQVFETLPDWIKDKIKKSTQYQQDHTPADTIEFPPETPPESPPAEPGGDPERPRPGEECPF